MSRKSLHRIALVAAIALGYTGAMYTSTGCGGYEATPTQPETLISGRVLNAITGAPVANATVTVTQGNMQIVSSSRSDGGYGSAAFPGEVRVTAAAPGYQPFSATVTIRPGTVNTFDIKLQPAA